MRAARILRNSVRSLRRHRLRTFFMMLGTFIGVTALTVMLAVGRESQARLLRRFDRIFSGSTMYIRAGGGRHRGGPHGDPATTTLTLEDTRALAREIEGVELVDPMQMAGEREVTFEGTTSRIRIEGHSEAAEAVWNRSVTRGAYFTAGDVAASARVALVGETVARGLFQGQDAVGRQIRIGAVPFQVIGVLAPVGLDPHGLDKDNEIVIPITTMLRRVRNVDHLSAARLALSDRVDMDSAEARVRDLLRRRHGLDQGQEDDFGIVTPTQVRQMVKSSNRVFTVFLPLVAGVSILVGGLVVANLMLMTVHDRRAEIGLRKAIGARPADIQLQFLVESAAVTGLGGLFAIATGYLILGALAHGQGAPPSMPWTAAAIGLASAVGTGLLAGVLPARRAARLEPVQTLR
ncbi:MAG: ABC transporter permease [Gemmatimonadales bacterium]